MRNTCLHLTTLLVAALLIAGCDSQSAQINAAQQKLDQVLAAFAIAQRGYAPVSNTGEPQNLQVYRQEQLAALVPDLESVIATGSADQKKTASRLLASVHLSAARYGARNAAAAFAELSAKAPVLDGALRAAERAQAQAQASNVDYDATLAQLANNAAALGQQRDELARQADTLKQQIDQIKAEQDGITAKAQAAAAEARKALDAAFIAEGDEKLAQQTLADEAQRTAGKHSAEAEKRQVEIDMRQRSLDVVQAQLDTVTKQIADLKTQADTTRKLQADTAKTVAAAQQTVADQAAALKTEFDARAAEYATARELFDSSAARVDKALELLAGADTSEQLGALMDDAYINTEHALAAGAWTSMTDMVATIAEQVSLPQASDYRAAQKAAAEELAASLEAARSAVTAAREQAAGLGEDAASQTTVLDGYAKRLK